MTSPAKIAANRRNAQKSTGPRSAAGKARIRNNAFRHGLARFRAARALIRWTAEDLSRQSAVSLRTIRRAELAERDTSMTSPNDLAVRRALEVAGVEYLDENGGGPGVRLRKRQRARS